MALVNTFKVGADPELVLLDPPQIVNGAVRGVETAGYFGFDHGGYVVEPHPTPDLSVRQVCKNIRTSLDYMHYLWPNLKFRAGAYYEAAGARNQMYMGGHVHLDIRAFTPDQIAAMDSFTASLEHLDLLPRVECARRAEGGFYGKKGDIRAEHGHVEYRSMCSWLFDPKIAMLCMTGAKLAAINPAALPKKLFTSKARLTSWFEGYKEADDDVRWMFDKGYFEGSLVADPDASVKTAWKTSFLRGKALAELYVNNKLKEKLAQARAAVVVARQAVNGF